MIIKKAAFLPSIPLLFLSVVFQISAEDAPIKNPPATEKPAVVSPDLDKTKDELKNKEAELLKKVAESATASASQTTAEPKNSQKSSTKKSKLPATPLKTTAIPEEEKKAPEKSSTSTPLPTIIAPSPTPTVNETVVAQKKAMSCNCSELEKAKSTVKKLSADLTEAKNRLLLSETEVERLSTLLNEKNKLHGTASTIRLPERSLNITSHNVSNDLAIQPSVEQDMSIGTVIVDNAELKSTPNIDSESVMTVAKGAHLPVETKSGDWFRVISPSGVRAWIPARHITFGTAPKEPKRKKENTNLVPASPEEDAAFAVLSKGAQPISEE